MTDWFTDELFQHDSAVRHVFQHSRYFCDVERLRNDPMEAQGQGIAYTKLRDGKVFRVLSPQEYGVIMSIYTAWHENLTSSVLAAMKEQGRVVVVDCHSFCAEQVHRSEADVPDVCIGINDEGDVVLQCLARAVQHSFERHGVSTALNHPYGGAIAPVLHARAFSIMIEVNKRVYMDADGKRGAGFAKSKRAIGDALASIRGFEESASADRVG